MYSSAHLLLATRTVPLSLVCAIPHVSGSLASRRFCVAMAHAAFHQGEALGWAGRLFWKISSLVCWMSAVSAAAALSTSSGVGVCYDLFPFLLIYFLFCLSLCAAPCLALLVFVLRLVLRSLLFFAPVLLLTYAWF